MSDFMDGRTRTPKAADVAELHAILEAHKDCEDDGPEHECRCFLGPPCKACVECPGPLPKPWRLSIEQERNSRLFGDRPVWAVREVSTDDIVAYRLDFDAALAVALADTDEARRKL